MVDNARSANVKLLIRKLGVTETNIVPNMFARSVFPRYGSKHACFESDILISFAHQIL